MHTYKNRGLVLLLSAILITSTCYADTEKSNFELNLNQNKFKDFKDRLTGKEIESIFNSDDSLRDIPTIYEQSKYLDQQKGLNNNVDKQKADWNEANKQTGGVTGSSEVHKFDDDKIEYNYNGVPIIKSTGEQTYVDTGTSTGGLNGLNWFIDMNRLKAKGASYHITSQVYWREYKGVKQFHTGLDLDVDIEPETKTALAGKFNVYAPCDGEVLKAGQSNGYGNIVNFYFKDTTGQYYGMSFGHLDRIEKGITSGTRVKRGQLLGRVGQTGGQYPIHLHVITTKEKSNGQLKGILTSGLADVQIRDFLITPFELYGMDSKTGYGANYVKWCEQNNFRIDDIDKPTQQIIKLNEEDIIKKRHLFVGNKTASPGTPYKSSYNWE